MSALNVLRFSASAGAGAQQPAQSLDEHNISVGRWPRALTRRSLAQTTAEANSRAILSPTASRITTLVRGSLKASRERRRHESDQLDEPFQIRLSPSLQPHRPLLPAKPSTVALCPLRCSRLLEHIFYRDDVDMAARSVVVDR